MKYWQKCYISVLTVLILLIGIAAPALAATFYASILVTNTGSSYDMLSIVHTVNVTYMADSGYISANGTDVTISVGGITYPRTIATENISWATQISGNASQTYQINTGQTPSDMELTFGDGSYVTVNDAPAIEPSGNFSIEAGIYTNSIGTILSKGTTTLERGTDNITFNASANSTPTGHNDPGGLWSNEANAYDNNTATFATATSPIGPAAWQTNYLYLTIGATVTDNISLYISREDANIKLKPDLCNRLSVSG